MSSSSAISWLNVLFLDCTTNLCIPLVYIAILVGLASFSLVSAVVAVDIYHQIGYVDIYHQIKTFISKTLTLAPQPVRYFHVLSICTSLSLLVIILIFFWSKFIFIAFIFVINVCIIHVIKFFLFFFPIPLLYSCTPLFTVIPNWNSVSPATGTPTSTPPVVRDCTSVHPATNLIIMIPFITLSTMTLVRAVFIAAVPQRALAYASAMPSPKPSKELMSQFPADLFKVHKVGISTLKFLVVSY